jgi:hypothetical protein
MRKWRLMLYLAAGLALLACPPVLRADDDVRAKIKAAGDAKKWNADVVGVVDDTDVTIKPNGLGVATTRRVTKVLREGGIRSQAVQRFPYDPYTNRLELIAIRIYREDGKIEEVPLETPVQQPQPASGIFWPTEQYLISLPRLAVGDAVESVSKLTGFNVAYLAAPGGEAAGSDGGEELNALGQPLKPPVPGNWHDEVHFWSGYPIIEKRYIVRLPKDKQLQFEVYNGELRSSVLLEGDQYVYTFEKKDIEPFHGEPDMESAPNVATKLLLATLPTWEQKAQWLYGVSEPQLAADDAIRAKVAEVIKDCKADEEKYTALNHWVAENIRYAGTSRGMCEGYTIHDVKQTFSDRCGVCKDKAAMLCGMLRVAGFDSYTVMTMARQRVDRIPADQFNHCVTCIKNKDGSLTLLDPTWMPKSRDNWSTLEPLQHVVYGLPEGKGLSQSPYFPPQDCAATWSGEAALDDSGRLTGSLAFTANGTPEGRLRRSLAGYPPGERSHVFDETFQRLSPSARAKVLSCTDPVDFSGPLKLAAEFDVPHFVLGAGRQRHFELPIMQTVLGDRTLSDLLGKTGPKERKYGLKLWATRLARFDETLRLPDDWKVVRKPEPVKLDGPSAGLNFELEATPGQLHYTCELVIKKWTIPPEEYANFKEVLEKFDELAGCVIACEVEGAHAER